MKKLKIFIVLFQLLWICETGLAQQVRFRNVLGNTGYDFGMFAQQTFDNGYIVCGSTTSVGSGNTDIYVIKTDSLGRPVKERSFGNVNVDRGTCIRQTADSGYVILGYTNSIGSGYDIYAIKTNNNLDIQWEKKYGGNDWDFGNCIEQTSDGGFIICGGTYSFGKGDEDYYLIKTDSHGDTLWTHTYGSKERDEAKSVIQTMDGGYAITGYTMVSDSLGDFYTIKTNSTGDTLWTNKYGGANLDIANDIIERRVGGYVITGETKSFGAGKSDGIFVEITPSGDVSRILPFGGPDNELFFSLAETADDKIMFAGITYSYGFTNGKGDIYFGMINSDWTYNMSTTFGSTGNETVNSVAPTRDKGAIICGSTNGFRNLQEDIYLIKTDSTGYSTSSEIILLTDINEQQRPEVNDYHIFPNPTDQVMNIISRLPFHSATISVIDVMGQIVQQQLFSSISNATIQLDLQELSNGIYFIKIETAQSAVSKRIIIQHD